MSWITLDDVRAHLNKQSRVDDDELGKFIPAACSIVESVKGHVDLETFIVDVHTRQYFDAGQHHRYPRWRYVLDLDETPVYDLTSVSLLGVGTPTDVPAVDPAADPTAAFGWTLIDNVLEVPQRGRYEVTYRAGMFPVPGNVRFAALELVAHLWRGSQLNSGGGRPRLGASGDYEQMIVPGVASALPYREREALGLFGEVVPDHVVIG